MTDERARRSDGDRAYLVERLRIIIDERQAGLTSQEHRVIVARFLRGGVATIREAARRLRMSFGTVRRRFLSALAKLRVALHRVIEGDSMPLQTSLAAA
jgi:DNA-directed RNA polymerase specialized sigma24 family protein